MQAAPEDRRLKALGLVIGALAIAWMMQLATLTEHAQALSSPRVLGGLVWRTTLGLNLLAVALALLARGCGMASLLHPPRRRRATLLWWGMANLTVPLVLYGMLDNQGRLERQLAGSDWAWVPDAVAAALALLLWRMWRRSRRHVAPAAAEAMAADARPPLLYLRSFADDDNAVIDDQGWMPIARLLGWIGPPSPEEEMARILQHAGPVVAIGRPGEELPQLGAARLYVSHAAWQGAVLDLMRQAQLVVIRVGASPGVRWEIAQALQGVALQRIVLVFHGRDAARISPDVQRLLDGVLSGVWSAALPEAPPSGPRAWLWRDPDRRIGSLVCFPDGRTAQIVRLSHWPPWGRDIWPLFVLRLSAPPLLRAWRVVFQRLGIEGGAYSARQSRGLAVLLAVFFGGFGAHWFYLGHRRRGWTYLGLLLFGSFMAGLWDALRFIWIDRTRFDALVAPPRADDHGGATGG